MPILWVRLPKYCGVAYVRNGEVKTEFVHSGQRERETERDRDRDRDRDRQADRQTDRQTETETERG